MGNPLRLGEMGIDPSAIGTQNRISLDQRAQPLPDMRCIEFLQLKVGVLTAAISHDQNRNLFGG
ncbi:hypothetical protein D3C76_1835680 [compost metagenome]